MDGLKQHLDLSSVCLRFLLTGDSLLSRAAKSSRCRLRAQRAISGCIVTIQVMGLGRNAVILLSWCGGRCMHVWRLGSQSARDMAHDGRLPGSLPHIDSGDCRRSSHPAGCMKQALIRWLRRL